MKIGQYLENMYIHGVYILSVLKVSKVLNCLIAAFNSCQIV